MPGPANTVCCSQPTVFGDPAEAPRLPTSGMTVQAADPSVVQRAYGVPGQVSQSTLWPRIQERLAGWSRALQLGKTLEAAPSPRK